jgi:hypothetical protein
MTTNQASARRLHCLHRITHVSLYHFSSTNMSTVERLSVVGNGRF